MQHANRINATSVYLFCDNQAAVKTIAGINPHPAQYASRIFRGAANFFLKNRADRHVHVIWTPGHAGIEGNELADKLANGSEQVAPSPLFNRTITWIKTNNSKSTQRSWNRHWANHVTERPDSQRFIPRKPQLKLHPIFNKSNLNRDTTSRLVQLLTGHGFYGEYRTRFRPDLNPSCTCGEGVETIIHKLLFCPSTEGQRHILRKCSPSLNELELFGSLAGLKAVSKFIAKTGIGKLEGPPAAALDL